MSQLRIRYRQRELELEAGVFLIGRAASNQISLDDPMVSRVHARLNVRGSDVTVEDLGSSNGVLVNGARIQSARPLAAGDRITIGAQDLDVVAAPDTHAAIVASQSAATQRFDRFSVVSELADKALALGHADEAERLLRPLLADVAREVKAGQPEEAERAVVLAAKLAAASGDGQWVNYAVEIYAERGKPWPASIVDQFYDVLRKTGPIDLAGLGAYAQGLREKADSLGPADRFLVGRIEGLERLARTRG